MSSNGSDPVVKCSRCKYTGPQSSFPRLANFTYTKHCHDCAKIRKGRGKKNTATTDTSERVRDTRGKDTSGEPMPQLSLAQCLSLLEKHRSDAFELHAQVNIGKLAIPEGKGRTAKTLASAFARSAWDSTGYRWNLRMHRPLTSDSATINSEFYCAQLEGEQTDNKLHEDESKQRARVKMTRYHCNGWLNVTINERKMDEAVIRVSHHIPHPLYNDISIPTEAKKIIETSHNSTPTKIYEALIKQFPAIKITEKQVYRHWSDINKANWRKKDDQVASAAALLAEYDGLAVDVIEIKPEDGLSTIAFSFRDIINDFGVDTQSIAMDSTWKTNAAGYELYAIVAEANGTALPLAFVFTTSSGNLAEGAKTRMLEQVLQAVGKKCPNICFVHSDKDLSEINAAQSVFPDAKHQLCMWHGPRYVKERLAENKLPAHYDPRKAHQRFSFIDPTWAPGVMRRVFDDSEDESDPEDDDNGPKSYTSLPPLFILVQDGVRRPVYPNPPKPQKADLGEFCPAEFRELTLDLYTIHGRLHPEIPINDTDEPYLSADDLYKSAVYDMYFHCWDNDLVQVWAYMWNRWYSPSQWVLWARAPEAAIPRIHTTMIVESLWKHIKHRDLSDFNRPRLDLVTYIIIQNLLPRVQRNLEDLQQSRRMGRGPSLVGWQKDFRMAWTELSKSDSQHRIDRAADWVQNAKNANDREHRLARIAANAGRTAGNYITDLQKWVCSCPAFLYSRFMLCKHLVHYTNEALDNKPLKDLAMFANLRRNHLPPYYRIPGIHGDESAVDSDGPEDMPEIHILGRGISRSQSVSSMARSSVMDSENEVDDFLTTTVSARNSDMEMDEDGSEEFDINSETRDSADRQIRALASDDEDGSNDRVYLSEAELKSIKRNINAVYDTISQTTGMAAPLAKALLPKVNALDKIGKQIRENKRRRKMPRTYKDSTNITLTLD
ncbi:unnamed protein product [Mycena citricolor]|uniref:SWIM-type domain-containing protein n=1 Tax=Mycena citricolor TaxID=2018698 RepID=A0AAD2H0X1_9AGAR|nr:unnamed protein product [Mycena citricolor]